MAPKPTRRHDPRAFQSETELAKQPCSDGGALRDARWPYAATWAATTGRRSCLGQATYFFFLPFFFAFFAFLKSPPRASLAARVAFI